MKALIKSKEGSTLVEIVIAVALLAVISSGILTVLITSHRETMLTYDSKPKYEEAVGKMDIMLDSDTSAVSGDSVTVNVEFPVGGNVSVDSKVIKDPDLANVAVVKKN